MTTLPQHLRTISDRLLAHAELHDVVLGQTGDDEQRQLAADLREAAALLTDAPREQRAQVEIERLRRALHEVAEEWVGAECGEPVHAQEAYAIALAQRMYRLAAEALAAGREADTGTTHADGCWNWGARHYECALREIERMQAELNDWRRLAAPAVLHANLVRGLPARLTREQLLHLAGADDLLAAERERCAAICDAIEDQAWARWRVDADPTDQGRSTGAAQCAGEIRRLR